MTVAREVVDRLLQRLSTDAPARRTVVRPSVTRDDVNKLYIHRARPVVQRVRRVQHIVPVVQPVIDDVETYSLPPSTHQRVGALRRRSSTEAWSPEVRDSLREVEDKRLELATGRVSESHVEDVAVPEEVTEVRVEETVEDVMPLHRRTIRQPTVVEEVQPVHEVVTETASVGDIEYREPVSRAEWGHDAPAGGPAALETERETEVEA